jgi:hypothetical protein
LLLQPKVKIGIWIFTSFFAYLFRNLLEKSSKPSDIWYEILVRKTTIHAKTAFILTLVFTEAEGKSFKF